MNAGAKLIMTKLVQLKQTDLLARAPKQARGKVKVEKILAAAEELILKHGADGFSSPMVAESAGIPVASVYQFFPTRYAILRTLAERNYEAMSAALLNHFKNKQVENWTAAVNESIDVSAAFSNDNPISMALFLNGPVRAEAIDVVSPSAMELANHIAKAIIDDGYAPDASIPRGMEPITLLMDLVQTVFAASYRVEGKISDHAREEAKRVAIDYLGRYMA